MKLDYKQVEKELEQLLSYQMEYKEELHDTNSFGSILRHKKSGARICLISNEDENKVFSIGFRTPPKNSTGVAHIIEHTVLCGSKKFPVKDPFIELAKGSLNTFLNAMTYSDKTIYPVASCNDKDFKNLMQVYMDAVLFPNIYQKQEIFEQEGWHYELNHKEDELTINGIVYSEMKGAFSSPEQQLYRGLQNSLYPDTSYGVESGGDPEYIPKLSYEEYLDFHRTYYHPSNSYIYLYGNMDMAERLRFLDEEYLSQFDTLCVDSTIEKQQEFGYREVENFYSVGTKEEEQDNTYLSYNAVISSSLDAMTCVAFQILEAVLLSSPGAPLKQALLEAGIGSDILSSFDGDILQPYFSIIAKNANKEQKDTFLQVIKATLQQIVGDGLKENSLRAAINLLEFRYRESDYGQFPKGLLMGIQIMSSWLYDDHKAFIYLHGNEMFDELKKKIGTGYYEELIQVYLLQAKHATCFVLSPKKGLNDKKEEELRECLAKYKASLSEQELNRLVEQTQRLKAFQETPSTKEELATIPMLTREDIGKEAKPFYNQEKVVGGIPVLHHEIFTNGIAYLRFIFDTSHIRQEDIPYLSLLTTVLGYIDTKNYSFLELSNQVNMHTGNMHFDLLPTNCKNDPLKYYATLSLSTKLLYDEMPEAMRLMEEIIQNSIFTDTKRLHEILREMKSRMQMRMNSSGHTIAVDRAFSYLSNSGYYGDLIHGIEYFRFIEMLEAEFDERAEDLVKRLSELTLQVFDVKHLMVSITAEEKGYAVLNSLSDSLCQAFYDEQTYSIQTDKNRNRNVFDVLKPADYDFALEKKREGFTYAGQVQYVALCGNYIQAGYHNSGALRVIKTILGYDYLWVQVRVKGGAYGCMCSLASIDGSAYFVSYRDPNLKNTLEVYQGIAKYLKEFRAEESEITKYIIGTMSTLDAPLTPAMQGSRSLGAFLSGITIEDIRKEREEIRNITLSDIHEAADLVAAVVAEDNLCVIGNEKVVKENRELFYEIKPLLSGKS